MSQSVQAFFEQYEEAISSTDPSKIGALYADFFLFGGPQGVQCVKKEDFLKVIPRRKEYFSSIGLLGSTVTSVDQIRLDSRYLLVRTAWKMTFSHSTDVKKEIEASASYLLEQKDGGLAIVFQIDHQDLAARAKEVGLS
ncbi:MAG TPA: nuclear transport factor 2 family protein [Candidatus Acidoferrum sp.]|nr:nuclear transport factor 2 family protein [Candidatus Acidoferrum sp.]